ncbi:MAG: hypothetical protein ACREMJ_11730 [Gemmatimonadales bacterium]
MNPRLAATLSVILLLVQAACGDWTPTATAPRPGQLVVALRSANLDDGAIHFRIDGGEIADVAALDPEHTLLIHRHPTGGVSVIVVGTALAGPLVRFHVPDVRARDRYRPQLLGVADTDNRPRSSINGYGLSLVVDASLSRRVR